MSENEQLDTTGEFDDHLEGLAKAVRWCLANRESVGQTLRTLREAYLRGEDVQADLSTVLDRCPDLRRLCFIAWQFDIESAVEALLEQNILEPEGGRQFLLWWSEQRWITEGFEAYLRSHFAGDNPAWTETSLAFRLDEDGMRVKHTMKRGLDDVNTVTVRAESLFDEAAWQAARIVDQLADAVERGELEPDRSVIEGIRNRREALENAIDNIERIEESADLSGDRGTATGTDGEASEVEELFSQIQDTSERSIDSEESIRGFH